VGIIGPIPEYMMKEGRLVSNFFTREGLIYQEAGGSGASPQEGEESDSSKTRGKRGGLGKRNDEEGNDLKIHILVPKKTTLKARVKVDDAYFLHFVRWLLEVDPTKRPSAREAMNHPWLTECQYSLE
jgi:serine/threonine protein kinase